ncbi:Golgi reassembly-stacking protein 2 [Tetranychus urticae]|uniref:PDZ GRASP-type domain-containing protein n=1 Tax=Tetranychus urticae TaxID=32264 RepID=T1KK10_TETUR|nr:Golgi reassembly-stacking protein 2 [Tetranychus urticae]
MGLSSSSLEIPGGGKEGYHVLKVQEGSPGAEAGLQAYFDFIVSIGNTRLNQNNETLKEILKANINQTIKMTVFNSKTSTIRQVDIRPSSDWGGTGLIGVSIRFCSFENANQNVWHILQVEPNSPAEQAGLQSNCDYIIGADSTFQDSEDLYLLIESHDGKQLKLFVYNLLTDNVRDVLITPNSRWGGEGLLGCGIGYGYLHRIPYQPSNDQDYSDKAQLLQGSQPINTDCTQSVPAVNQSPTQQHSSQIEPTINQSPTQQDAPRFLSETDSSSTQDSPRFLVETNSSPTQQQPTPFDMSSFLADLNRSLPLDESIAFSSAPPGTFTPMVATSSVNTYTSSMDKPVLTASNPNHYNLPYNTGTLCSMTDNVTSYTPASSITTPIPTSGMPPSAVSVPLPSDLKTVNINYDASSSQLNPLAKDFMNMSLAPTATSEVKPYISASLSNPIANPSMTYSSLHNAPSMPQTSQFFSNLTASYSQPESTMNLPQRTNMFPLPMKTTNISFPTPEPSGPYSSSGFVSSNNPSSQSALPISSGFINYTSAPSYTSVESSMQQPTTTGNLAPLTTINLNQPPNI